MIQNRELLKHIAEKLGDYYKSTEISPVQFNDYMRDLLSPLPSRIIKGHALRGQHRYFNTPIDTISEENPEAYLMRTIKYEAEWRYPKEDSYAFGDKYLQGYTIGKTDRYTIQVARDITKTRKFDHVIIYTYSTGDEKTESIRMENFAKLTTEEPKLVSEIRFMKHGEDVSRITALRSEIDEAPETDTWLILVPDLDMIRTCSRDISLMMHKGNMLVEYSYMQVKAPFKEALTLVQTQEVDN